MAGAARAEDGEAITDINVTPLVDVSLVLVIIFMAIAPLALQSGIKVLQSKASAAVGKVSASENVAIRLEKDGTVTVNGAKVAEGELLPTLVRAIGASKDQMATLSADDENKVGQVVSILDTAKQAGARKIAIMTTAKAAAGRGGPAAGAAKG